MITGFILKGDGEGRQAAMIFRGMMETLPLIGEHLAFSLLGPRNDFQIVYLQHVCSAVLVIWLVTIEHARLIFPTWKQVLYSVLMVSIPAAFLAPSLHDGLDPVVTGPWYFLGLQEILHQLSRPWIAILIALAFFLLFMAIPKMGEKYGRISRRVLLYSGVVYLILCAAGFFFRGENHRFEIPPVFSDFSLKKIHTVFDYIPDTDERKNLEIPLVSQRPEGCLVCHDNVEGFSASHNPRAIGCSSCHRGNPFTLQKKRGP